MRPDTRDRSRPPNILFIMADQLAACRLGCYGSGVPSTPVLDGRARAGASTAVTPPTRCAPPAARRSSPDARPACTGSSPTTSPWPATCRPTPRCCASTVTAPRGSASSTRPCAGRAGPACPMPPALADHVGDGRRGGQIAADLGRHEVGGKNRVGSVAHAAAPAAGGTGATGADPRPCAGTGRPGFRIATMVIVLPSIHIIPFY